MAVDARAGAAPPGALRGDGDEPSTAAVEGRPIPPSMSDAGGDAERAVGNAPDPPALGYALDPPAPTVLLGALPVLKPLPAPILLLRLLSVVMAMAAERGLPSPLWPGDVPTPLLADDAAAACIALMERLMLFSCCEGRARKKLSGGWLRR